MDPPSETKKKKKFLTGFKKLINPKKKNRDNVTFDGSNNLDENLPQFNLSTPIMENREEQVKAGIGNGGGDAFTPSPSSSRSGTLTLELARQRPGILDMLDTLSQGRRKSSQSAASETSLRNIIEWQYKVIGYQEKYHVFAQEKLDGGEEWNGDFPKQSEHYRQLKMLARGSSLTKQDIELVKWVVLTDIQREYPSIFLGEALEILFAKIVDFLGANALSEDMIETFWESAEKLVVKFLAQITEVGNCMKILMNLPAVPLTLLCFVKFFSTLKAFTRKGRKNITNAEVQMMVTMDFVKEELMKEFSRGASEWFENTVTLMDDCTVVTLTDLAFKLRLDLNGRKEILTSVIASFDINLFEVVYSVWTAKFSELACPVITYTCENSTPDSRDDISNTTVLDFREYENLYYLLDSSKQLFMLAETPKRFHDFFRPCVPKWLDANCVKALSYLERAVKVDSMTPELPSFAVSNSAIDTECIFHTMEKLWNELDWPELEERYTYGILIIKNLDRCIMHYAELVANRLQELDKSRFEDFEIPDELCIALNNVEKIRLYADNVVHKLMISNIIEKLSHKNGGRTSMLQCRNTPPALMENLTDKVNRKMLEFFSTACDRIQPVILLYLETATSNEIADIIPLRNQSISHFNRILAKLKSKISPEGFEKIFPILWNNAFEAFADIVEKSIQEKKSPLVIEHLKDLFFSLESLFFPESNESCPLSMERKEQIVELKSRLEIHSSPSAKLVMEYYLQRYESAQILGLSQSPNFDWLTVAPDRISSTGQLRIQVLNAVLAESWDWDCFVKFQIVTPNFTENTKKYFTETVKRNKYLIFDDEMFTIDLTEEDWSSGGVVHFWLKGRSRIKMHAFLGEAFVPLKDIPIIGPENPIRYSAQVKLPLTKPREQDSIPFQVLRTRTDDRFATNFVKLELNRMNFETEGNVTTP